MKKVTILIKGNLNKSWEEWFEGFEIIHVGENTILKGNVIDHAALHGVLNKIRDLNLKLISVGTECK